MPQLTPQATPSDSAEVVLGVDTHKDVHVAAVLTTLGVLLATSTFPTSAVGYRRLLAWARGLGPVHRAGVECTGSYGAALTRYLRAETITVIEVNRGDRAQRRRRGKNDTLDAETAARAVLSGRATAIAKSGDGRVEMLRMFQASQGFSGEVPQPGDQPTQGYSCPRRTLIARVDDRPEQPQHCCAAARS